MLVNYLHFYLLFIWDVESVVIARFSAMHRVALPHVAHVVTHMEYLISESPFDHIRESLGLHSFLIVLQRLRTQITVEIRFNSISLLASVQIEVKNIWAICVVISGTDSASEIFGISCIIIFIPRCMKPINYRVVYLISNR